jgi:hypothetical protein
LAQIRIRFQEALIPVESLDSPNQQAKLKQFEIQPPLPGQFRFLTPRMVGFQAEQALPQATQIRITLKAGLADLKNHRLDQDLAWTFNTAPIQLTNLPGAPIDGSQPNESEVEPIELKPTLKFTANTELDIASVQAHVQLMPEGGKRGVPLKATLEKTEENPDHNPGDPQAKFDSAPRTWTYAIAPRQTLEKATRYRLEFSPGLKPVRGNLASENTFTSQVSTYAPLAFQGIQFYGQPDAGGVYGRFIKGSAQLRFNNVLVTDSALQNITINPAPKPAPHLVQAYEGDRIVNLNPWALEPATNYTITIAGKLKDKFGQTLGKPVTLQYNTGDVAADLWAPSNLNIFPTGKDLQLNVSVVNLPENKYKAAYRVVQPTDLVYNDSAYPKGEGNDLLPNLSDWQSFKISGQKKNQPLTLTVPLREKLGTANGMLAYGVQARTNRYEDNGKPQWREPTFYGLVQLTNLGVFAQWFPEGGLLRVHHLADGSPATNTTIEIYESNLDSKSRTTPTPCATGRTDSSGTLRFDRSNLQTCIPGGNSSFLEAPKLLAIAREGSDWAFTRTDEYSGAYGYGVDAGWDNGSPESRGTIFSDRHLYQPGETAWFTGAAYYLQNGVLQQAKNARYTMTLEDPDGNKTELGTQTTNDFGTFSVELLLKSNQPLGYYSIRAKGAKGEEITGDFRVAAFKPPNFKVDLALDKSVAFIGQQITAIAQSNYLFGAPVEGGQAKYYVTREQTAFVPKGWQQFSFGRQWFWPEESPTVPSDVLQTNQVLNQAGQSSQVVTVAKDLPYPMTYRVDAEVTDVSNLSVADAQTFTALPSDRLIGLQSNFVADAGKAFPVQIIVTDPSGQPQANQRVRVELQKMDYSSVTKVVEGSRTNQNQIEYKTVAQAEVRSGTQARSVDLMPPEAGSYRIRANFVGANSDLTATDLQMWVTGDSAVGWGDRYRNNRLEIKLDKESYQPGETATALIQSPYPEAELYFAVVRHNPLYQTITKVKGGAPQIQFQVTPEMLPNAAVEAVLVRQGVPLAQVELGSLDNLVRIGLAPFKTDLSSKYLQVQVTPGQAALEPGAEQTVQLELKDAQGQPSRGQFSIMVVNEAVLQLSGYRPPDLVKTVYAEQPISLRFADNRPDVVLEPQSSPLQKGWGYGGGRSAGAANTRTRTNFQPLAYYNGSVLAKANGRAQVSFKLPDDLTTWRVLAIATDGNLCFGQADSTFMTTKPLLANPILPPFARPGDRLEAGLAVTNNTGQAGNIAIAGTLQGNLQFTNGNRSAQTQNLQAQLGTGTQAYRFPITVGSADNAQVRFTADLNGNADAFEVPLEIKSLEITEQVVETGATNNKQVKIPLNIDKKVVPGTGGLEVSLASTLIPEITVPAQQVLKEEQLPFLEPAASQLAIAARVQTLAQKYNQPVANFDLAQSANQALERIQKLQQPDGGFAAWPEQTSSDPFITAYAAEAIAQASRSFTRAQSLAPLQSDSELISRVRGYLQKILADPGQYDFCTQALCKNQVRLSALSALAELGDKRSDFLADLYEQREQFDPGNRLKLARYLFQFPQWQPEAQALTDQLQETISETGRTATVNLPPDWRWLSSTTATQAQALRLLIAQKARPEVLDRLVQGLLNQRRQGTWGTTYDNAMALAALVDYSQLQPTPPNFSAIARLAGQKLGAAQFQGYRNPSLAIQVPMNKLPKGRHDLVLQKSGAGTLHYLAAYRYRLQGNPPGRLNGLRVVREIRPANETKVLQRLGLYAPDKPLTLSAAQVFDVALEIITDHPVDHVVITDPLPAGLEAVDTSFQTSTSALQAQSDSWEIGYQTIHRDRVVAYGDRLAAGVYTLHYLVRSVTPGTFLWPGANVHLQYAPEEFGRSAASTLVVAD